MLPGISKSGVADGLALIAKLTDAKTVSHTNIVSSHTFSDVNLGEGFDDRILLIGLVDTTGTYPSTGSLSCTVNGTTAAAVPDTAAIYSGTHVGFFILADDETESADIVVTHNLEGGYNGNSPGADCSIFVWAIRGLKDTTDLGGKAVSGSSASPYSATLTSRVGGLMFGIASLRDNGTPTGAFSGLDNPTPASTTWWKNYAAWKKTTRKETSANFATTSTGVVSAAFVSF
jgi:hypothetical protein